MLFESLSHFRWFSKQGVLEQHLAARIMLHMSGIFNQESSTSERAQPKNPGSESSQNRAKRAFCHFAWYHEPRAWWPRSKEDGWGPFHNLTSRRCPEWAPPLPVCELTGLEVQHGKPLEEEWDGKEGRKEAGVKEKRGGKTWEHQSLSLSLNPAHCWNDYCTSATFCSQVSPPVLKLIRVYFI